RSCDRRQNAVGTTGRACAPRGARVQRDFCTTALKSLPCCSVLGRGSDVAAPVRGAASAGVIMSAPVITLIGGPTTLIEANGFRLLTDPTFDAPGEYKLPHVTLKSSPGRRGRQIRSDKSTRYS